MRKINPKNDSQMKKISLSVGAVLLGLSALSLQSCIGSFALTSKVINWNKQVGNKFVNELVFFAFWVLPVYEVTSIVDVLVLNSIEFWSGNNPMSASIKAIDTDHGRYLVECDGKGYKVTHCDSNASYYLAFDVPSQTWSLEYDGESYPMMTMIDADHVKMITPGGDFRGFETTAAGLQAYEETLNFERANDVI